MADATKTLSVTEVARRLKVRYHRARDLMLSGKLGATTYAGSHLTVTEAGLAAYLTGQGKGKKVS